MVDRREQRRLVTRRKLLDAAAQVFGTLGYQDATVLDITEAADVSKRTFYLHFTDKEAVIEALALREFEALRAKIEAREEDEANPHETFREGFFRMACMIFEYVQNNPEMMQIVFGAGGSFRLQAMTRDFMARAFEENMNRKCFWQDNPSVPPTILGHAIAGVLHQLMCCWFRHDDSYSAEEMAGMSASVLFDNIEINFDMEKKAALRQQGELPIEATS